MRNFVLWVAFVLTQPWAVAQTPRVRDSAGVRIVENGPRLKAPVIFQLGDKPTFDYGGLQQDPADELSVRNGYPKAIRIPNGNFAILDRTRVLFFDSSGRRIKFVGREGRGPGEFTQATDICATRGDTILVGQYRQPITKLTASGDFVGTIPLPEGMFPEGPFCFDDGTWVLMNRVAADPRAPSVYRFTHVGPDGPMNTIVDHRYPPFDMLVRMENPKSTHGSRMYSANGNTFDILAYDRSGKLVEIIRTSDALVPITDREKERLPLMATRAGASAAEVEDARRRAIRSSPTTHWPTVGKMYIDLAGRLWVEDWRTDGGTIEGVTKPSGWAAFDSTGRLLGRLVIPGARSKEVRRFVVGFGKNEVIFNRLDDDGAVHYTAYPILPIGR